MSIRRTLPVLFAVGLLVGALPAAPVAAEEVDDPGTIQITFDPQLGPFSCSQPVPGQWVAVASFVMTWPHRDGARRDRVSLDLVSNFAHVLSPSIDETQTPLPPLIGSWARTGRTVRTPAFNTQFGFSVDGGPYRYVDGGKYFTFSCGGNPIPPKATLPLPSSIITTAPGAATSGATASIANITMNGAVEEGYITADACGSLTNGPQSRSNGNFEHGRNAANLAIVPVDRSGSLCLYNFTPVHEIVDVQGELRPDGPLRFTEHGNERVLDTRSRAKPAAGSITKVATGQPPGTAAVVVNLTMTEGTAAGYITADRCSVLKPGSQTRSNGNFEAGQIISNLAIVPLDPDGNFCIFNQVPVHELVDIQGLLSSDAPLKIEPQSPKRVLDTRTTRKPEPSELTHVNPGAPAGTKSVLVNLTMTEGTKPGFITANRCTAGGAPGASNGNYEAGQTTSNLAVVDLDDDGGFCIYTLTQVHLVVDVQAALSTSGSQSVALVPAKRILDTR